MSGEHQKRREDIQRALNFIKCSLPYPDPEGYEGFVVQLVCDLLDEGNAAFREGDWTQARGHFSEAVNVALYAQTEGLNVPAALLESLYINRAAVHQNMGEFDSGVKDCDLALEVCKDSAKALYRKAVCLKESGKLREAYDCSAACLLASPQDQTVSNLSKEIAASLGLKNRKAYISSHRGKAAGSEDDCAAPSPLDEIFSVELEEVTDSAADSEWPSPVLPAPVPVSDSHEAPCQSGAVPLSVPVSQSLEDSELMGDELDNLLDCMSKEEDASQSGVVPSSLLCFSSPRLPPAFFSSFGSQLNSLDSFTKAELSSNSSSGDLDALDTICPSSGSVSLQRPLVVGRDTLDSLSEFSLPGGKACCGFLPSVKLTDPSHTRNGHMTSTLSSLSENPLEHTHDFTQACSSCFSSTGPGVLDFELRSDVTHSCKKDLLLCRRRGGASSPWRRIRPRPTRNNFQASFVLCREVLENQVCKYGEGCTFAYCQEEIDVWTQERRGLLVRELLFNPLSTNERQALGVIELLNIHTGMFMFLCEACFDCRPRMIGKRWKENPALCANAPTQHQFDKKCLVHVVKSSAVSYSKLRALSSRCQFDVCRQELALGCKRKDGCCFAHSLIELQIWILQRDTGISHEEIVQESKKHWNKQRPVVIASRSPNKITAATSKSPSRVGETNGKAGPVQGTGSAEVKGHGLELMMKFVCCQCWKDGLVSEPDRALKYCTAKARHSWTKDRRVLLVKSHERKKWVSVRPLPFAKTFPQQYDICIHVLNQRKCHYIGNCSFAHSQEEKDLWTYMKNNGFRDFQQVFDVWLSTSNQNRAFDCTSPSQPMEEKQITMPTDFAEAMLDSFYCPLCGKHSNSDRQWQQHISSEKHKHRVFSGEGEDESLAWSHRFPGPCFSICPRLDDGCADGASCDFAHSEEELQEWCRRRDFLRRMLNKARADMLISPTDNYFGIYNFLLQN
ncbi:zinc finger CCCH-type containing 7Ba isoform X2 [Sinocyclocheilus rhinocerous]|uniref:zinc finger CCCH-type containing 7Ba isoform X2 n=1 Tax=Sinocyclocheilus rhinocerous TaxID=307959 RepID=UPI0007B81900|nr:PREDICTED: zinc finger CCCH domain-containing protein 7B-like isoform X2 [Sinocyclocheilus rhinocerous]